MSFVLKNMTLPTHQLTVSVECHKKAMLNFTSYLKFSVQPLSLYEIAHLVSFDLSNAFILFFFLLANRSMQNDISHKMSNLLFDHDINNLKHCVLNEVLIQIYADKHSSC